MCRVGGDCRRLGSGDLFWWYECFLVILLSCLNSVWRVEKVIGTKSVLKTITFFRDGNQFATEVNDMRALPTAPDFICP